MSKVLSAGLVINALLTDSDAVMTIATDVFPGVSVDAELPYVSYRRKGIQNTPTKGVGGAMAAEVEVTCYAQSYGQGVALAEAVLNTLEGKSGVFADVPVRGITLTDGYEDEDGEAKMQVLIFTMRL